MDDWQLRRIQDQFVRGNEASPIVTDAVTPLIDEVHRQRRVIGKLSQEMVGSVAASVLEWLEANQPEAGIAERDKTAYEIANRALGKALYGRV